MKVGMGGERKPISILYMNRLAGTMFLACFIPWMTVTHLFWPFKETKRNPQFTFFSVAFTSISILLLVVVWILVQFSNM